ncbi:MULTISPECIES: DUF6438 domain-containing protein [Acidobacteriaceae]|uniref:DUF6438 domain-containing protein n=1 Tax=Acidobacteriaceae TaxID=204434 RepID=UPI00131B3656|nr:MULTISPECIES: DUF6438 domain-containing protein [Acidobacteriaceae]MDW5265645.1 DUF6438 domain-containing protein [Edaphobacter sp.]
MKMKAVLIVGVSMTVLSASGQVPKPGFGDEGCPETSLFAESASISGDDFIEVHRMHCSTNCPLYTVRVYGDGRLAWHGDKAVSSMGDATARVDAGQAQTLIANARQLGFGGLCDEYVMRAFDGSVSITSLRIGGRVKTVANAAPSNAPSWLYKLDEQIAALNAVQNLIGVKQDHPQPQR